MDKNNFIFSSAQLKDYLTSKGIDTEKAFLENHTEPAKFFTLIPKYYLNLINWYDPADPLRQMAVASSLEDTIYDYELQDPIGDHSHEPVPGIIHRYPDRCLLMLTNVCAIHCRFCFRKNLLTENKAMYEQAMEYIKRTADLWEVIFSGGDPFMLTDYFLNQVMNRLDSFDHIRIIRFHTRTPAVFPRRITDKFIRNIRSRKQIIVVIHINHPREITPEFIRSLRLLKKAKVMLLSQTVLLKGVNDNTEILAELFKELVAVGVKPYYLHHLDPAAGTHYFRISVEEGKKIYQRLRGTISGHCIPEYVIDSPGGHGKIPVMWFERMSENEYEAVNFEGKKIRYTDYC